MTIEAKCLRCKWYKEFEDKAYATCGDETFGLCTRHAPSATTRPSFPMVLDRGVCGDFWIKE